MDPLATRDELTQWLGPKLATALDQLGYPDGNKALAEGDAPKFLNGSSKSASNRNTLDYDSARQLVWAYRIIYEECERESRQAIEKLYKPKTIDRTSRMVRRDRTQT